MKTFAALAALLAVATANPVAMEPRNATQVELDKRDTEIVYLLNCKNVVACCPPLAETYSSRIAYYSASGSANGGNPPSSNNVCTVSSNSYTTWESNSPACTFPTNVRFTTHIDGDAQSRPNYSWAGWGTNGFKNFNCYKDDGHQLYRVEATESSTGCNSIYYCVPQ